MDRKSRNPFLHTAESLQWEKDNKTLQELVLRHHRELRQKEESMIRSWLVYYPDKAFIVPDGTRLYLMREGQMLRLDGKDFDKMTEAEINYILQNVRPVNKEG